MPDHAESFPSRAQALRYEGPNPTADMVLLRHGPAGPEVLLIVRSYSSEACPGMPAFPGGFIEAADPSAERHEASELPEQAGRRELFEETGFAADSIDLLSLGTWDSPNRDPRNSSTRHVKTHAFCAWVPYAASHQPLGLDDAEPGLTAWVALSNLAGATMAFDHGHLLSAACKKLGAMDPHALSWSSSGHDALRHQASPKAR